MNKMEIHADVSTYDLFYNTEWGKIRENISKSSAVIIDQKVFDLYEKELDLGGKKIVKISVSEKIKTPQTSLDICEELVLAGVNRGDFIVAVGGGVIQDLVTFSASIYMRGIDWVLYPTTLLAQADSCIGGKSSINFKNWKNILGNFYAPSKIYLKSQFLQTLTEDDIRSGIGEILKVFMLSGYDSLNKLIEMMRLYQDDPVVLDQLIIKSLELKNEILKVDALDKGLRLKMNYGHSFGHALEAATHFNVPHGIAVTIGLDIANYISYQTSLISQQSFERLHSLLSLNLKKQDFVRFEFKDFISALEKDKKNKKGQYGFIVPISEGEVELKYFEMNNYNNQLIENYFKNIYGKWII